MRPRASVVLGPPVCLDVTRNSAIRSILTIAAARKHCEQRWQRQPTKHRAPPRAADSEKATIMILRWIIEDDGGGCRSGSIEARSALRKFHATEQDADPPDVP